MALFQVYTNLGEVGEFVELSVMVKAHAVFVLTVKLANREYIVTASSLYTRWAKYISSSISPELFLAIVVNCIIC